MLGVWVINLPALVLGFLLQLTMHLKQGGHVTQVSQHLQQQLHRAVDVRGEAA